MEKKVAIKLPFLYNKIGDFMKKTELLIPAGNIECLHAAINNGADAVYLGGKKFGARAYSNNFNDEEIINAINLCHINNVKVYVTVNTMIFNEEVDDVLEYLKFLYINNVDAVLMQDNGMIELVRKTIPNLQIHISTQAHNHNEPAINRYKELGCTRVVFDRESSLESIKNINVDIEKEVFVYGALCICYSGNCLFSALNGGRSANRGMCVGSCRLEYKLEKNNKIVDNGYLLSTKDLNTMNKLKELLDSNIDSLKIEGRMKSKEYVAIVTKTYRKLIDAYYNNEPMILTEEEKKNLLKTYNREFTNGYLFNEESIINKKTSNHQGIVIGKVIGVNNHKITIKLSENIHQEDAIRFSKINKGMYVNQLYNQKGLLVNKLSKGEICILDNKDRIMYDDLINSDVLKTIDYELNKELNNISAKNNPINMIFNAYIGSSPSLEITYKDFKIIEKSEFIISEAKNQPVTELNIKEQLSKLGNTPFVLTNIKINMDNNIFINLKELNNIRRNAITKLIDKISGSKKEDITIKKTPITTSNAIKPKISILTRTEEQLKIALANKIDYIYVTSPILYNKYKTYKNIYLRLERVKENFEEYKNERLLVTEFGSLINYGKNNKVRTDYYMNVANDYTVLTYNNLNAETITLSVELDTEQEKNIKNKNQCEVIIYGSLECMIIKNNIFNINNENTYLIDNKNNKYKILFENGFTHIFNCKKIDKLDKIKKYSNFNTLRIELLDENIIETQNIINKIKQI